MMRRSPLSILILFSILAVAAIASTSGSSPKIKSPRPPEPVVAPVIPRSAGDEALLANLRDAKQRGDIDTARELSQVLGWPATNSPPPRVDSEAKVVARSELINADKIWQTDILVSNPAWQSGFPAMAARFDGTLYLVCEDLDSIYLDVYYSIDRGQTWTYWLSISDPGDPKFPSIAIGEGGTNRIMIAYETDSNGPGSAIKVWIRDLDTAQGNIVTIENNPYFALKYPQVCVDYPEYTAWYPYLTYSKGILGKRNDIFEIRFSRSLDYAVNWAPPTTLVFGVSYEAKPDIDFGDVNLYVVYTESVFGQRDVHVVRSSDYGSTWDTAVPLATSSYDEFQPRVAATNGGNAVVVGYTITYGEFQDDIESYYSTDLGGTWYHAFLPYFPDVERAVDLDVSWQAGKIHAAYYHQGRILYTYAGYATPWFWAAVDTVNDTWGAMWGERPTLAVDQNVDASAEQRVAWGDIRDDVNWRVYFDAAVWDTAIIAPGGGGDYPTIQAAIDAAGPNPVVIELTNGVFTGPGNVNLDFQGKAITLESLSGNPRTCIIDCQGTPENPRRGIWFANNEGQEVSVRGITIRNGYASSGPLTGAGDGGGILVGSGSFPSLENLILEGNAASDGGGGLHYEVNSGGTAILILVKDNASSDGGGGVHYEVNAAPTLINCTVVNNTAPLGAGMYCETESHPVIETTIIAFNNVGMAVYCDPGALPTLFCCDVFGNEGGDWTSCIADQLGINANFTADPLFCLSVTEEYTLQNVSPCLPENSPCGELVGVYGVGCVIDAIGGEPTPAQVGLDQNWPNPFNPMTTISFRLPHAGTVELSILTVAGDHVVTLISEEMESGQHMVTWTGCDARGRSVASGTYIYRLQFAGEILTRPMVLVR